MMYATLNDAANNEDLGAFMGAGDVKIWYYKDEFGRDACMGREFCEEHGLFKIDINNLAATHTLLGAIKAYGDINTIDNRETVFCWMQGEIWSPMGQARDFLHGLGIHHTSMSVGDIMEFNGDIYLVDRCGFIKLNEK